jgi:hypothetical protein
MKTLPRRTMLRGALSGATVALALPALDAMIGSRETHAATDDPIFGLFYWANGMPWHDKHGAEQAGHPDLWTPAAQGVNYAPSELLTPLAPFKPTVATGYTPHTEVPAVPDGQSDGHMRGFMVAMTGDRIRPEGFDHPSHTLTALRPTLDQYVAKHPDYYKTGAPLYSSLVLGASTSRFHEYGHWNAISYNGPDSLNQPILDPAQLYTMLFAQPTDGKALGRRAALLDAVKDDANQLKKRLGSADRARIEAHLDHLNEVQRRLAFVGEACAAPAAPGATQDLIAKTEIMGELLATALACNITRVFSFMLTSPATTHVFSNLGVPNDMHTTCHNGEWQRVKDVTLYQMTAFAAFLGKLQAVVEPNGKTLLDRALVFGTSEYGEGFKHSVAEMGIVLAGGARGKIRQNVHVREEGGNFSKAHVTILRALGLNTPSFGFNGGETTEALSGVLV